MKTTHRYTTGPLWFIASLVISCINDTLTKWISNDVHYTQITCARLFFGLVTLLPYAYLHPKTTSTTHPIQHLLRGSLFVLAASLWSYGLSHHRSTITTATIISFTTPLFVLLLSAALLKETLTLHLTTSTCITLAGLLIILWQPTTHILSPQILPFILAAILFATLDVINKYHLQQEPILTMILYANLFGTLILLPFALQKPFPTMHNTLLLFILGLGGNGIIFCILKAYKNAPLVALAPLRYLELPLSTSISILLFHQLPSYRELLAALIIIPAVLYIIYEQQKPKH